MSKEINTALIVDDEIYIREVISEVLDMWDIKSLEAGDGAAAIKICEENKDKIDLIFLDLNLPQMSGLEIYSRINEIVEKDPLFVFISGFDEESIANELPEKGNFLFLKKPFTINSIQTIIEQMRAL